MCTRARACVCVDGVPYCVCVRACVRACVWCMSVCACVCVCLSLSLSLSLSLCARARRARVCVQIDWIPVAPPFLLVGHSAGSLYMRQVHFVHEDVTGVNSGEFGGELIAEILPVFSRASLRMPTQTSLRGWCSWTRFPPWRAGSHPHCSCGCRPSPWSCAAAFFNQWGWCCVRTHPSEQACTCAFVVFLCEGRVCKRLIITHKSRRHVHLQKQVCMLCASMRA